MSLCLTFWLNLIVRQALSHLWTVLLYLSSNSSLLLHRWTKSVLERQGTLPKVTEWVRNGSAKLSSHSLPSVLKMYLHLIKGGKKGKKTFPIARGGHLCHPDRPKIRAYIKGFYRNFSEKFRTDLYSSGIVTLPWHK